MTAAKHVACHGFDDARARPRVRESIGGAQNLRGFSRAVAGTIRRNE
jgi:hypothetical protein